MHPEEQYATRALKAGAAGYLQKESAPAELVSAVRKIARGGKYVSAHDTQEALQRGNYAYYLFSH
jgi:DNA-binding NarL/FixJ family response regulator